jgi:RNA polymerase sigma-70 factor (ECF subfamily)
MVAAEFKYKLLGLQESLLGFAFSLTSNYDTARDLVQETLLKALTNSDKFAHDTSLKAWAFTILKNTFINDYRRKRRQGNFSILSHELSFIEDTKTIGIDDPSSAYSVKEMAMNIEQLHESLRTPLKLRIVGFKYKEIANELNLNMGTVKSRIFLSRKQLVDIMNR